jgi:NTP pyrophosphatase (non-canonical NTP hydrolase)
MNEVSAENRHSFFIRRLKELGVYGPDSDYGGIIGKAIEELSAKFAEQGHSGMSAEVTMALFEQLMREYCGLTPMAPEFWFVLAERKRQDEKWGRQDHGPDMWLPILAEELGEVAKAILEGDPGDYRKELIQIAAVAIAALEALGRGIFIKGSVVALQTEVAELREKYKMLEEEV